MSSRRPQKLPEQLPEQQPEGPPEHAPPPANLRYTAVGGALWSAAQRWLGRATQFLTFLILARLLHPSQFGLVALASFFVGLIGVVVDMGLGSYLVQRAELGPRTLETAFWLSVALGTTLTLIVSSLAPLIADVYHHRQLVSILRALSATFVLTALSSTQNAILQRQLKFRELAMRSFIATVSGAVVAIAMAYSGAGVWSLVGQSLTSAGVAAIVLWQVSRWRPSFSFCGDDSAEMFGYGTKVIGIEIMGYLRAQGGELIIASILGTAALGVFTVASRLLGAVVDMSNSVILTVAGPIFARVKGDRSQLTRAYKHAMCYSVAMTAPVLIVLAVNSPRLVPRLFGQQWQESGGLARILCIGAITSALTYFDRSLLLMVNKARAELGVTAASMVSHLVVLAATAPFGLHFVVISLAVRNLLFWPFRLFVARRYAGIDVRQVLAPVLRVLAAAAIAAPAPVVIYLVASSVPPIVVATICGLVMVPAYAAALYVAARPSYQEFRGTLRQGARTLARRAA